MSSLEGSVITKTFPFDGGRGVAAYMPPHPPGAVVYAADGGWHAEALAKALEASVEKPSTMIVGVHGLEDDDGRLSRGLAAIDFRLSKISLSMTCERG